MDTFLKSLSYIYAYRRRDLFLVCSRFYFAPPKKHISLPLSVSQLSLSLSLSLSLIQEPDRHSAIQLFHHDFYLFIVAQFFSFYHNVIRFFYSFFFIVVTTLHQKWNGEEQIYCGLSIFMHVDPKNGYREVHLRCSSW